MIRVSGCLGGKDGIHLSNHNPDRELSFMGKGNKRSPPSVFSFGVTRLSVVVN